MAVQTSHILISVAAAFFVGLLSQKAIILLAGKLNIFARPDHRRRHEKNTPSTGGVGVLMSWAVGLGVYSYFEPQWFHDHLQSTLVLGISALILHILGLWDDLINMGPYPKLIVQSCVGIAILVFEPNIHSLLLHWENKISIFSWLFGFLWIVGITNSINLIDGIDGLAGSMSILSGTSILILLVWAGNYGMNAAVYITVLLPALAAFLVFNWNPAKIFLGDNGSLPVGMILSSASLMGYAQTTSWVMVLSLILIFGYPILDMTICVLRRYRKRQAIFKGDRVHLHFRINKLGLSVRQTVGLLIVIGVYLQVSAVTVNLMEPPAALLGLTLVFFSIFTLLFLIRSIEAWKVSKVFSFIQRNHKSLHSDRVRSQWTLSIDLAPMLEKSSNHLKTQENVQSLESLLRTLIRDQDQIVLSENKIIVIFTDAKLTEESVKTIQVRFQSKVDEFITLFNIECSMASLQIQMHQQVVIQQIFEPLKATGT